MKKSVTAPGVREINKYGTMTLRLGHSDLTETFDFGDVLTVSFGNVSFDAPLVTAYSCVDTGAFGVFLQLEHGVEEVKIGVNMGNICELLKIAGCPDPENAPKNWVFSDGFSEDMDFTFELKEKGGYLDEFTLRSMSYTDDRSDYPNLSDAEFGNFREVKATGIRPGVLFRSATALNPKNNRNIYVDNAARKAGVTVFIDLVDRENDVIRYDSFETSYFKSQKHVAVGMGMDISLPENREKLKTALEYIAENRGVYDIFCLEGKDRSGFVVALLEALMGAELSEIKADYMKSYENYYGLTLGSEGWEKVWSGNLYTLLEKCFGCKPENCCLRVAAEKYLKLLGLSHLTIEKIRENLT